MKVKLSLLRPGNELVDLVITAEPTTPISELARELHNADPNRTGPAIAETTALSLRLHSHRDGAASTLVDHDLPLSESNVTNGATVSIAAAAQGSSSVVPAAAATITATDGPVVGQRWSIPSGSSVIGRDPSSRIAVADPLVSKAHVRVNITDIAEIIDMGSANGTLVNGQAIDRAILTAGDVVTIGDTSFTVDIVAGSTTVERAGVVHFNRSPRLDPQFEGVEIPAPEPPERPPAERLPLLALLAPLGLGVVTFIAAPDNILSIVMIVVTPLLLVFGFVDTWWRNRRRWKQAQAQFAETVEAVGTQIDELHNAERTGRDRESPGVATVVAEASAHSTLLWTRRPEHDAFLSVRLGTGLVPSRSTFVMPNQRKGPNELWTKVQELQQRALLVSETPVVESFRESGSIGIAGPGEEARSVTRGVIAQLVALHSPAELVLVAMASTQSSAAWDWLKWLPHVGSTYSPIVGSPLATGGPAATSLLSELEGVVSARHEVQESESEPPPLPIVILLVEDDAPVERARLVSIAERGPKVGVHVVWTAPSIARIPAACRTFVEINPATGASIAGYVHTGFGVHPVDCERLGHAEALVLARSLAPVVDDGARADDSSDLPRSVSLLHLLGTEIAADPESVIGRWTETNSILTGPRASTAIGKSKSNLRSVFGQASSEPFALDLRLDGPHALVGGTTGSGKSEFLQAWVLGLAAAHSPQRVSFLFVDYKGGAAFADCVDLPHSVGLVTDLSPHLVRRALTSLRAELRYREHLLNKKKVKDIVEFERTGDPAVPPSLIIVVDEFAALATEVPEFVDGVVDVAQRGRSLGLHLILATQRPAGVIRDNLRANTNLRVALRMADESDSDDVLGSKMAASFDPAIPGRGAAKTGPGRIRAFQSGYAGGWTSDVPEPSRIDIEELRFGNPVTWPQLPDPAADALRAQISEGPNDIKRIVKTIGSASKTAALPELRRPWLPELAESYDLAKLPNKRTDVELLIGVTDDAQTQSQPTVNYVPDRDGNMAIIGTGGSGKSTALRTIAVSAAVTVRGGPVHVYGLDFGSSGLTMLEKLPHVGAIVQGDDDERVARLLRWVRDLVDDRAVRFAAANAGDIVEYRRITGRTDEPRILLLLDGMGAFREAYEANVSSPWFSVFSQIATDGRPVGVNIVVTGDRAGAIPVSLGSSIQRRLVLRLASADDYGMLGVEADVLSPASPPGRGILDGLETQVAVLGGDGNVAVQARQLDELAEAMTNVGVPAAPPIRRLPDVVALREIAGRAGADVAIGLADDTLQPVGIDPIGSFVIGGPPSSGRTTALATIGAALAVARPGTSRYLLSPRRSPLTRLGFWSGAADTAAAQEALVADLAARVDGGDIAPGSIALFLENIAEFAGSSVEYDLERIVKGLLKQEQFVVAEAETSTWSQAYSIGQPLRAGRRGLLVQPDDGDGDLLLNTTTGRIKRGSLPQGRGFLIGQGRARKLQVAVDDTVS